MRVPLVAVIVTGYVPAGVGALTPVEMVMVEEPEPVTESGLKPAVAPAGSPLAAKLTVPPKPFDGVIVAVYVVLEPVVTEREPGVTDSAKSGGGGTA